MQINTEISEGQSYVNSFTNLPVDNLVSSQYFENKIQKKKNQLMMESCQENLEQQEILRNNRKYLQFNQDLDEDALKFIQFVQKNRKDKNQIDFIEKYMNKHFSFFDDVMKYNPNSQNIEKIFGNLKLEFHNSKEVIFQQGDFSDAIYFILAGEITVLIPKKSQEIDQQKLKDIKQKRNQLKSNGIERSQQKLNSENNLQQKSNLGKSKKNMENSKKTYLNQLSQNCINQVVSEKGLELQNSSNLFNINKSTNKEDDLYQQYLNELDFEKFLEFKYYEQKPVNVLGKHEQFGEVAVKNKSLRTASVVCSKNTVLILLKKEIYEKYIEGFLSQIYDNRIKDLQKIPIFSNWKRDGLEIMLYQQFEEVEYQPKQIIFKEGEKSEYFYLIEEGEVEMFANISGDDINKHIKEFLSEDEGIQHQQQEIFNSLEDQLKLKRKKVQQLLVHLVTISKQQIFGELELIEDIKKNKQ